MTVYCLLPVHNRIEETKAVLRALCGQTYQDITTIIIDDGSTDGTSEYLLTHHPEVSVLHGNGDLWWTGAIARGLEHALATASDEDYILLQNNDTGFGPQYVAELVDVSRKYGGAVVGSPLRDRAHPDQIISIGPSIHYWKVRVEEAWSKLSASERKRIEMSPPEVLELDALSGRGTLYPVGLLRRIGLVRHLLLPHYWADYELSVRAKQAGAKLLVAMHAPVLTENSISGIRREDATLADILFSKRSRTNILNILVFYSVCGPWFARLTAVPRVLFVKAYERIKRSLKKS